MTTMTSLRHDPECVRRASLSAEVELGAQNVDYETWGFVSLEALTKFWLQEGVCTCSCER